MIEVQDTAGVEVLHHEEIAIIAPILYLDLALSRFLHPIHEHTSEVFALSCQDGLVAVDWLVFHHEHHVRESWIVNDGSHVADQTVHCLIIDFVFF